MTVHTPHDYPGSMRRITFVLMTNAPFETLNDKHLRWWGVPLISLTGLLALMQFYFAGRWDLFGWYFVASVIYTAITWEICRMVLKRVRRRIPGLEYTAKRLALTFFYFLVIAGIGNAIVKVVLDQFGLKPPSLLNHTFFEWWLANFASILFFVLLLSSIYEAIYFFDQYKIAHQKAEQLKKQQVQQRLEALKTRVNPHFLFNSLTTLSALIGEDAPRAEVFVDELSKVYRYLLRVGRQPTATLGEELQFAESYAFLLKNRFEPGAFSFSDSIGETRAKEQDIPVLTLQNSLDYLVRTQNAPLHIHAEIIEDQLRISCNHHPKSLSVELSGSDWQQLENNGAYQQIEAGQVAIIIPFISNSNSI